MATCPRCQSKDGLILRNTNRLHARPVGSFSLAGVQTKLSAVEVYELIHPSCGWLVSGTIRDGYLLALSDWEPNQQLGGDADEATG